MSRKRSSPIPSEPDPPPWTPPPLSSRHAHTLELVNETPIRGDIPWRDIESLFEALGGSVTQGRGSRVRVAIGSRKAVFHEPHPEKVTDKGAVKSVRIFLDELGVRP